MRVVTEVFEYALGYNRIFRSLSHQVAEDERELRDILQLDQDGRGWVFILSREPAHAFVCQSRCARVTRPTFGPKCRGGCYRVALRRWRHIFP